MTNAIFLINGVISLAMIHFGMRQIFDLAVKKIWVFLGYILLFLIISQLFFEIGETWLTILINIVGLFAISFLYFGNISTKVILMFFIYVMTVLAEGLAFFGLNFVYYFIHETTILMEHLIAIVRTFTNLIFAPLLLVNIMIFRKIITKKAKSKGFKVPVIYTIMFFSMLVGIIFSNGLIVSILVYEIPERILPLLISYLVSSFVVLLLIWLYNAILKYLDALESSRLKEQMFERWEIQYKTAVNSQKLIKTIKHDIGIHFLTLSSYLQNDKLAAAKEHLESIIGSFDSIITTENLSIDTMLNYYQQKAKETLEIDLNFQLLLPPNLNLEPKLTGMILGNALENAIEACLYVADDKRYIHVIAKVTKQNELYIEISNPYNIEPIADKAGNLKTVKADKSNHGLGLSSIRESLPEDVGQIHTEYADNTFRFMVIFYNIRQ